MLGNPVGVISDAGSSSLQRELSLEYPLNIADVQHTLSVCAEDGAAAVVIALNSATLSKNALQSVNIDVLGAEKSQVDDDSKSTAKSTNNATATATNNISFYSLRQRYGFSSRDHSYCVTRSTESDELAQLADEIGGQNIKRHLSLAIAMVLAAGVRRGTIKSALRVSHELR